MPDPSASLAAALLEVAADGVLATDERGTIVLASASAASMLGWAREELVGTDVARILSEPLAAAPLPWGSEGRRTLTGRRRDGSELRLEVTTSAVEMPQGRLSLAVLRDATDQHRDVEALARSEAWLRELIDHAPDGILVVGHDGRYAEANESMCRMLGYSRDELVGMRPIDITDPEDALRLAAARARLSASGGALELVRWTFVHKDGTRIPTEINARILADGRRQAFVRDIRPREQAERELRIAEAERAAALRELEVAIEQCPVGITILRGTDGRNITLNRVARTIWSDRFDPVRGLQQPTGVLCQRDGTPLAREEFPAIRAIRGERIEHGRHAIRMPDGRLVPYEINAAPWFDEHGAVAGAVVIAWDVSALIELERLRTEWSSLVAHDFRQPIHGISLFAQMALRHARTAPERVPQDIAEILGLVARLKRMTGDLLDFSRIEASRLTIEWKPVDLVACVRSAVERIELEEPEIRVEVQVEGEIPPLEGDPQRLAQVMDNLLSNACKYRRPGSPVRVHVERERERERVVVAVTNEGEGIAPADIERLFQRFERLGAARTGVTGIGLGLQITRGLVEAHGGTIAVQSVPGQETTFRFTLPLRRPGDAAHERDPRAPG